MAQHIKPKPIIDIRFDSISGYLGQGLGPLLNEEARRIAKLFVLKLSEEHRFGIGREDHLVILYSTDLRPAEIEILENNKKTHFRTAHVGFSKEQFENSGSDGVEYTVEVIASVLAKLVEKDSNALASVKVVKDDLLRNREQSTVQMLNLFTQSKGFNIEPYLKLTSNICMYLRVTEIKTGRTGETLFLEGTESEIFRLVKSLSIKEESIVAKHAPKDSVKNKFTIGNYLARGLSLPVEVRLNDIFEK